MKVLLVLMFLSSSAFATSADRKFNIKQYVSGTATTASTSVLSGYTDRCYLAIYNSGSNAISVKINSAHTGTEGYPIAAGAVWSPNIVPVGTIYLKTGSSTSTFEISEGSCI